MIVPVILSGGSGTRLWPVSTAAHPKQFHALVGETSMFRQTLDRAADRTRFAAPIVVCGAGHIPDVEADLAASGIEDARIIVEPAGRNTAPAIALAAQLCNQPGAIMLAMPADHVMRDVAQFHRAIDAAMPAVLAGALATFGIDPAYPETGYGYIAASDTPTDHSGVHPVRRFVEKPDRAAAEIMLREGGHYWNAGIFLMRPDDYLAELARQRPAIAAACTAAMTGATTIGRCVHPEEDAFLSCPADSIDYAVMEGAREVVVAPVDPGWSDVGGWAALYELSAKDADGNVHIGDVAAHDARGNYVRAAPGKRVSIAGLGDLVVVVEGDDILILPRSRAQDVKTIAERRS